VLRNRATGDALLVVVFSLYLREDVNPDGTLKPTARESIAREHGPHALPPENHPAGGGDDGKFDEEAALAEAKRRLSEVEETNPDDVD